MLLVALRKLGRRAMMERERAAVMADIARIVPIHERLRLWAAG
jgi:hypothetical protein